MKNLIKNFIIFFAVFLVLAGIFSLFGGGSLTGKPSSTNSDIGTLVQDINNDKVTSIVVEGTKLTETLNDKSVKIVQKESTESLSDLLKNSRMFRPSLSPPDPPWIGIFTICAARKKRYLFSPRILP